MGAVRHEKLYHVYHGIKQRCYNRKNPNYYKYGGKGIIMCDEWLFGGYQQFKDWAIQNGYKDGLTIDRIDSDGNYDPKNCRWITLSENSARANIGRAKNKTKLSYIYAITPNGDRVDIDNISEFTRLYSLNYSSVSAAIRGRMSNMYHGYEFHSNLID